MTDMKKSKRNIVRTLTEVDGFLESWLGEQAGGVTNTSASGNNLSSTTVDSISV
jgi:hypothetical protein